MSNYSNYTDVFDAVSVSTGERDYKKEYVKSVYFDKYVALLESLDDLKEYFPEEFI